MMLRVIAVCTVHMDERWSCCCCFVSKKKLCLHSVLLSKTQYVCILELFLNMLNEFASSKKHSQADIFLSIRYLRVDTHVYLLAVFFCALLEHCSIFSAGQTHKNSSMTLLVVTTKVYTRVCQYTVTSLSSAQEA